MADWQSATETAKIPVMQFRGTAKNWNRKAQHPDERRNRKEALSSIEIHPCDRGLKLPITLIADAIDQAVLLSIRSSF